MSPRPPRGRATTQPGRRLLRSCARRCIGPSPQPRRKKGVGGRVYGGMRMAAEEHPALGSGYQALPGARAVKLLRDHRLSEGARARTEGRGMAGGRGGGALQGGCRGAVPPALASSDLEEGGEG